jgi:hypothetical protein
MARPKMAAKNSGTYNPLHNDTALPQLLEQLGEQFLRQLLDLILLLLLRLLLIPRLPTMLPSGIPTTTVLLLAPVVALPRLWWVLRQILGTRQIDIHAALILLRLEGQSQFLTKLFHARFDLLHMIHAVVPPTHNNVQMCLALLLRRANSCS